VGGVVVVVAVVVVLVANVVVAVVVVVVAVAVVEVSVVVVVVVVVDVVDVQVPHMTGQELLVAELERSLAWPHRLFSGMPWQAPGSYTVVVVFVVGVVVDVVVTHVSHSTGQSARICGPRARTGKRTTKVPALVCAQLLSCFWRGQRLSQLCFPGPSPTRPGCCRGAGGAGQCKC